MATVGSDDGGAGGRRAGAGGGLAWSLARENRRLAAINRYLGGETANDPRPRRASAGED